MKKLLMLLLVTAAVATLGAQAQPSTMTAKEKANLQHVRNWWLECLEGRNLEATAKYQADSYIQHNINFPTGRAGFMKVFGDRFKAAGGSDHSGAEEVRESAGRPVREGRLRRARLGARGKGSRRPDEDLQVQHLRHAADRERQGRRSTGTTRSRRRARRTAARRTASTTTR